MAREFARDVWCLFGLPVDNLTLAATKDLLRTRVKERGRVVLSTINVNWVVHAFSDPAFRKAILNSDLVVLDGRPLLWLAKLIGYPMTGVVPGSTLIHEVLQEKGHGAPLSLFLFGGEPGAAEQALARVNKVDGGLKAVGALNPGFGTVAEMSGNQIIAAINKTVPDILLVALGAQKGARWIEHNRHRLEAKVISHLGATVNFLAGTVRRAPVPVQQIGMEWCWRILQEPKLFVRYASDALVLLRLVTGCFLGWRHYFGWQKHFRQVEVDDAVDWHEQDQEVTLSFGRNVQGTREAAVRQLFCRCVLSRKDITLDFQQTEFVDGAFMGLLLLLMKHQQANGCTLHLINIHGRLSRLFDFFGVNHAQKTPW
jgi:N-acetylglucosaminyldiphosphoundecaprenol N-acetyl-beta-D-mannosaminyltransferase